MNPPLTPNDVALRLAELSRLLDAATAELVRLDEQSVRAKQRYEVTYAKAYLQAEGPVASREQLAVLATENERLDKDIAEQQVRAVRERIRTLHAQLDVGRSLGAALRAELSAIGGTP